jgi:hypothetical protein
VEAINPYFRTVDKESVLESGIPILVALLKDENHSIRISVMQQVMELSEIVGVEGTVNYDSHKEFLDKILTTFFKDHNYAVREQTIKSVVECRHSLGADRYL